MPRSVLLPKRILSHLLILISPLLVLPALLLLLPTLTEVLSCGCTTLRHIPRRARQLFGMVLAEAMKSIIVNNNIEAWTRFLMIPKCVLPSSKRGGKKRQTIPIERLCHDWLEGKEGLLWSSASSKGKAAPEHKDLDDAANMHNRLKSTIYCAQNGQFSKACSALISKGVAPNCSEPLNFSSHFLSPPSFLIAIPLFRQLSFPSALPLC